MRSARYHGRVRRLCTLLAALAPLAAWGAEPGLGADAGRAYIVRDVTAERVEVDAQLVYDHRVSATASGAPRLQPVKWKSDATATLTTADGAFDGVLKLERTEVGTVALTFDGVWRRPTWVHVVALDVVLPADSVTLFGRDLEPVAAPPLAVLERFDPKWLSVKRGDGRYTLVVDDDVDAVTVKTGGGRVSLRIELETTEARPFTHDAACRSQWREPNSHVPVAARLRTVDEHVHARMQWIPDAAPMVAKAKFPDGRRAALVITDHADQTTARTFAALVHGLLKHQLHITKSLFAHGTDRPQLESPEVVKLADQLYVAGSEIVPHSATPKRDERPVTASAMETFARWHARTWIDHQPETNCEAFGDQGFRSTGKFAIADLLAAHGYDYIWAEVDLEPGPLNLLRADRLGQRAPTLWPIGRLDIGGPSGLWMFRSQWAFLEAKHFYSMYSPAALDRLERERGLNIAHTYLETYHPPHTKFGMKNLIVPVDAHEQAGRQRRGQAGARVRPATGVAAGAAGARDAVGADAGGARRSPARSCGHARHRRRRPSAAGADASRRWPARRSSWRVPMRRCASTASCRAAYAAKAARRPSGPTCPSARASSPSSSGGDQPRLPRARASAPTSKIHSRFVVEPVLAKNAADPRGGSPSGSSVSLKRAPVHRDEVRAPSRSKASPASSGFMCCGSMNQRGS